MRLTQTATRYALLATLCVGPAAAAQWEYVAAIKGDRIELDKTRITRRADGRTTAWSRIALDRDFIDEQGMRYTAIEALNRYDCEKRSFATVKRVYRRDGQVVREESVASPNELAADAGSADGKLLTEACRPRTVAEGQKIAEAIAKLPPESRPGKPSVMYADMRSAASADKTRSLQVADKAAERPAEKVADPKAAERPRYIELPKIDKSQMEDQKVEAKLAPAPAPAKIERAADKTLDRPADKPAAVRHDIERLYATSGPSKGGRKKAVDTPVVDYRHTHWAYDGEGAPTNWSKLRAEYATCDSGKRQSPIDIREGIKVDLEPIQFDYKRSQFRITDNGHTIQVEVGEGSGIKIMERRFELVQFHFHRPAEERINGKGFDMVLHLVHKDDDGQLAVVAVLLQKGAEHPLIQTLWNNMPLEQGQSVTPALAIDLNQLLPPPDKRFYFTYMGSLTTPPCSEDVLWMVFKQPIELSAQQVSIFARLYSHNARPLQPANGRLVKETR